MFWLEFWRFFRPLNPYDPFTQMTELTRLAELLIKGMAAADYAADPAHKKHRIDLYKYRRRWWRPVHAYCSWRGMVWMTNTGTIRIHDESMDGVTALKAGRSWRKYLECISAVYPRTRYGPIFDNVLERYVEMDRAKWAAEDAALSAEWESKQTEGSPSEAARP